MISELFQETGYTKDSTRSETQLSYADEDLRVNCVTLLNGEGTSEICTP